VKTEKERIKEEGAEHRNREGGGERTETARRRNTEKKNT
jgi:hypothetical protein